MTFINLGILAHVDAGKTSLTERLLHHAGVLAEPGRVDDGTTHTDTLALERRRGITIKAAVASFALGDVTVNLIDTPGHPDFIAEVERVLGVLDGAVLVLSAVEGVQAQSVVLMRTLARLRVPTLLFVNKIDRAGADPVRVVAAATARLSPGVVALGRVAGAGTRGARHVPGDHAERATEVVAEHDDAALARWVHDGRPVTDAALAAAVAAGRAHPLLYGSAITGAGVGELAAAVARWLPATDGAPDAPLSGTVFKVARDEGGERLAYARLFSGTLRTRARLGDAGKVTAIEVFDHGGRTGRSEAHGGEIALLHGLPSVAIGDPVGAPRAGADPAARAFPPPTLESVVVPADTAERGAVHAALTQLAEQDPLIGYRPEGMRVSLYGEVQGEVLQATLAEEYGLAVGFAATRTICVERVVGTGAAHELIGADENPFLATVGLRVGPAPVGSGVGWALEVELGSMPGAFMRAVEETVRTALGAGVHGWAVPDARVTLTHSGYWARQSAAHAGFDKSMSSTARDFRQLTPLVLAGALAAAGTVVCEPVHAFRLELPADALGVVLAVLAAQRATPLETRTRGALTVVEGDVPAERVHDLTLALPPLTRGEGVLESRFSRHAPVGGPPPVRPRGGAADDPDPYDRAAYVRTVLGVR